MNLSGYKRKLLPLGHAQCGGGGGGGCGGGGIGNALAGLDKSVGQIIPGGWATLGAVAATVATAGALAPEAFAADGAALGGEAVAAGEVGSELAGPAVSLVGGADVAAADAAAAGTGEAIATGNGVAQAVGTEEIGAQGAMAAGEATGGVATDAAGLPITEVAETAAEAAGTAQVGGGLLSGITGSQALMAGLLASSLLGKAQQPAAIPQPASVSAPPSLTPTPQSQAGVDPNTILNSLTGVGQGGGQKGIAQTLLTGAGGVDPSTLTLNKKTLLGS